MGGMNFKQITDRINAELAGEGRRLVFWYDDNGEFEEDVRHMELDQGKIFFLERDGQFAAKLFLERQDRTTSYLIYAPFPKPEPRENHLEDMLLYSKRFYADRASLLMADLGLEERYRPVIERHVKFFSSKERLQRFYDLELGRFNEERLVTGMLAVLCRVRTCSFEEVVRAVLTEGTLSENKLLAEAEKYGLAEDFWKLCERHFGYADSEGQPSLEKLVMTLFTTYTGQHIRSGMPKGWENWQAGKPGNVLTFMGYLMNHSQYRKRYDELSAWAAGQLAVREVLEAYSPDDLVDCDTFLAVDRILIRWIAERLTGEDVGAKLDGLSILQLCEKRSKMHFGGETGAAYQMLRSAWQIIRAADYHCPDGFGAIVKQYLEKDFRLDYEYRRFYTAYDQLGDRTDMEALRDQVERIYSNVYLDMLMPRWNRSIGEGEASSVLPRQQDFYVRKLQDVKERTVVIISDAMRYEVGEELYRRLGDDPRCKVKLEAQLSVLPSFTSLGMPALLPHRSLSVTSEGQVLVDGKPASTLVEREAILQSYVRESVCIQYDSLKALRAQEFRNVFTGKKVVYVYHNQIDARGDKQNTEDEVFVACEEAISEIINLIQRISGHANTYKFIITADHGFIYKRDKIEGSDKIDGVANKGVFVNRRFILSKEPVNEYGVESLQLGCILHNDDKMWVSFPMGDSIFKVPGGGQNYTHGGSSPQEMIIPVITAKMERGRMETRKAEIVLVSTPKKISSPMVRLEWIQSEPVSDVVKAAAYRLFFVTESGERISNENRYVADSREQDIAKRMFRLTFQFRDRRYDREKPCFLVVQDEVTGQELSRHSVMMDMVWSDDEMGD